VSIGGSAIPLEGLESTVRANRGARLVVLRGGPSLAWERVVGVLDALHVLVADRFALELAQKSADRVELSLPKADPASASSRRLVVIAINAAGRVSVDGMSVESVQCRRQRCSDDAAARGLVASRMQEGAILVVQADPSAPFERVLSVVRAVHELGPLTFGVAPLAPQ
jgi:biopolymer transport protein ExbD